MDIPPHPASHKHQFQGYMFRKNGSKATNTALILKQELQRNRLKEPLKPFKSCFKCRGKCRLGCV